MYTNPTTRTGPRYGALEIDLQFVVEMVMGLQDGFVRHPSGRLAYARELQMPLFELPRVDGKRVLLAAALTSYDTPLAARFLAHAGNLAVTHPAAGTLPVRLTDGRSCMLIVMFVHALPHTYEPNRLASSLVRSFTHELSHALDPSLKATEENASPEVYYNSREEMVANLSYTLLQLQMKPLREQVELTSIEFCPQLILQFTEYMHLEPHLTEQNRRRFLQLAFNWYTNTRAAQAAEDAD